MAVVFFALQIYCDFSGYSDIAIGTARIFGFKLMDNFKTPYFARSLGDFWRRWHISLSTWFKDYVYIPLGGNRDGELKTDRNLFLTFLISGLWHGANWTFVIWGALHGLYLIIERRLHLNRLPNFVQRSITLLIVLSSWIFFRADSLSQSLNVFQKIGSFDLSFNLVQICAAKGPLNLLISMIAICLLLSIEGLGNRGKIVDTLNISAKRQLFYAVTLTLLIITIGTNGEGQFIYFQF